GSEFVVRLPLVQGAVAVADEDPAPIPRPLRASEPALRILVVDDNRDAAVVLADALGALGHVTQAAFDGPGALRVATDFRPDLALLDIGLPVMDGYELARRLRALPGLEGVTLVAVTGYGQRSDRERSRDAGFAEHLVKPVDIRRIEPMLTEIGLSRGAPPPGTPEQLAPGK